MPEQTTIEEHLKYIKKFCSQPGLSDWWKPELTPELRKQAEEVFSNL